MCSLQIKAISVKRYLHELTLMKEDCLTILNLIKLIFITDNLNLYVVGSISTYSERDTLLIFYIGMKFCVIILWNVYKLKLLSHLNSENEHWSISLEKVESSRGWSLDFARSEILMRSIKNAKIDLQNYVKTKNPR